MENSKIKISIIVPVYNVEKYIRECLESIVRQTYKHLEIILVNDGSTDYSGKICEEYAEKDERIVLIHKDNEGLVSARKTGVRLARGEYITFVDPDDWIELNTYEELVYLLKLYHPDIITFDYIKEYSNFKIARNESLEKGLYNKDEFFHEAMKSIDNNFFFCSPIHITVWSKLFKAELIKKFQKEIDDQIRMGEDLAVVFPIMIDMNSIYITKKCFYHYRSRSDSINWIREKDEYYRYLKLVHSINRTWKTMTKEAIKDNKYLVYIYYYYLILCAPERLFSGKLVLFPEIDRNDNIILYGKGVFSYGLKKCIENTEFCNIKGCFDKFDIEQIKNIPKESYNYIVIAITDGLAVRESLFLLDSMGIEKNKILYVRKENLVLDNLPIEVQNLK